MTRPSRCSKGRLFNDLIGAGEQRERDSETECLGGPEVHAQEKLGWCLHRRLMDLGGADLNPIPTYAGYSIGRWIASRNVRVSGGTQSAARCSSVLLRSVRR
jgi:hypothetical protein